jgi:hypothetical protein
MTSLTQEAHVFGYIQVILRLINDMNEAMTAWAITLVLHKSVATDHPSPIALAERVLSLTTPEPCLQLRADVLHLFERNAHYLYALVHYPHQAAAAKREHQEALITVSAEIMRLTEHYASTVYNP